MLLIGVAPGASFVLCDACLACAWSSLHTVLGMSLASASFSVSSKQRLLYGTSAAQHPHSPACPPRSCCHPQSQVQKLSKADAELLLTAAREQNSTLLRKMKAFLREATERLVDKVWEQL